MERNKAKTFQYPFKSTLNIITVQTQENEEQQDLVLYDDYKSIVKQYQQTIDRIKAEYEEQLHQKNCIIKILNKEIDTIRQATLSNDTLEECITNEADDEERIQMESSDEYNFNNLNDEEANIDYSIQYAPVDESNDNTIIEYYEDTNDAEPDPLNEESKYIIENKEDREIETQQEMQPHIIQMEIQHNTNKSIHFCHLCHKTVSTRRILRVCKFKLFLNCFLFFVCVCV